jgi:hypothetical protein
MIRARSAIAPSGGAPGTDAGGGATAARRGGSGGGTGAGALGRTRRRVRETHPARTACGVTDRKRNNEGSKSGDDRHGGGQDRKGRMGAGGWRFARRATGRPGTQRIIAQSRGRRGPVALPVRIVERRIATETHV